MAQYDRVSPSCIERRCIAHLHVLALAPASSTLYSPPPVCRPHFSPTPVYHSDSCLPPHLPPFLHRFCLVGAAANPISRRAVGRSGRTQPRASLADQRRAAGGRYTPRVCDRVQRRGRCARKPKSGRKACHREQWHRQRRRTAAFALCVHHYPYTLPPPTDPPQLTHLTSLLPAAGKKRLKRTFLFRAVDRATANLWLETLRAAKAQPQSDASAPLSPMGV